MLSLSPKRIGLAGHGRFYPARRKIKVAPHQVAPLQGIEQLTEPGIRPHPFDDKLERPAVGQAKTVRGFRVDTVPHRERRAPAKQCIKSAPMNARDQVVLDASAGD
jgi:hypothetical protein